MFTDEQRCIVWDQIRQRDFRAFAKRLTPKLLAEAAKRAGLAVGRSPLNVVNLVWLGLAAAVHSSQNFATVLIVALKLLRDMPGWEDSALRQGSRSRTNGRGGAGSKRGRKRGSHDRSSCGKRRRTGRSARRSVHDPRRGDPTQVSEEAFTQARHRMPLGFWFSLLTLLVERFEADHAERVRFKQFRLLALDGTCVSLPSDGRLRDHFGVAANGKESRTVQARMVMLQCPLVRLPYRYALAPLHQGERTMAAEVLSDLRADDLVLLDRGFWSYGLFWQVQRQEAFFAIRLIAGVTFKTLRRLGPKDRLVRWTPSSRRWKGCGLSESIDLRVIDYQIKGFRPSAIVTSVTDPDVIGRDEWVRLAIDCEPGRNLTPGLYHRRWEIETTFLELKVRQGMERSLRSRTPEGIAYEVAGHVLLYLLVRWMIVEAADAADADPLRISFLNALRELLLMHQTLLWADPRRAAQTLLPRLLSRIAKHRVPWRPGRHYKRPYDTKIRNKGNGKTSLPSKLGANQA
jgi:hypothetical protein